MSRITNARPNTKTDIRILSDIEAVKAKIKKKWSAQNVEPEMV
jgi:hypothetical protein